jgi:exodeoxyribonuclease-3
MTWNVQHASAERSHRQAAWIASQPLDLAVLTEVAATRHEALSQSLAERGFTVCGPADSDADYHTLLASRTGGLEPWPQVRARHLAHRCVAARLHLGADRIVGILGLYVPSRGNPGRRNADKRAFQDAVTTLLPGLRDSFGEAGAIVVAGDLNIIEPGHWPAHAVFGNWEYAFYRAFEDVGYTDAYRHVHPHGREHSWYGRSGAGYRFDHIFTSSPKAVIDCRYDHQPRLEHLSDHSAMLLVTDVSNDPSKAS